MRAIHIARVFALANFLFVSVGLWIFVCMSGGWRHGFLPSTSSAPFALHFYITHAIVTAFIFAALVYSGIRLLRGGLVGAKAARFVYICELLYVFCSLCVVPVVQTLLPPAWRWSIGAGHVGLVSLWPQILTAYPVIGAVVMTVLIHREPQTSCAGV